MARPNRNTTDAFYDVFADMDPQEQEIAMRVLENTHRIAKRAAARAKTQPTDKPADAPLAAGSQLSLKESGDGRNNNAISADPGDV